jgi:hypothetical protein
MIPQVVKTEAIDNAKAESRLSKNSVVNSVAGKNNTAANAQSSSPKVPDMYSNQGKLR